MTDYQELLATDETFREVADLLFGGGADELIAKMNPAQSDVGSKGGMSDKTKRKMTAGLSAVGASAGAAGLALGAHKIHGSYKVARFGAKGGKAAQAAKHAAISSKPTMSRGKALKHALGDEKLATGLIPLEVAGLGGELMATKILHGDTKKPVQKDLGMGNNASEVKGKLTQARISSAKARKKGLEYTKKTGGKFRRLPVGARGHAKVEKKMKTRSRAESVASHAAVGAGISALPASLAGKTRHAAMIAGGATLAGAGYGALKPITHPKHKKEPVEKSDRVEVTWSGDIAKANEEKQQIFGWASVIEVNGEPVVDLQGDRITAEEMEKAGYNYVMKSRKGGDMHLRDDWSPIQKSEMIESFIVTDEKRDAFGLDESVPTGWWVGFQVRDPEVWAKVKSGERTGFSIHGHGRRTDA